MSSSSSYAERLEIPSAVCELSYNVLNVPDIIASVGDDGAGGTAGMPFCSSKSVLLMSTVFIGVVVIDVYSTDTFVVKERHATLSMVLLV